VRDGDDRTFVSVEVDARGGKDALVARVRAGIRDLLGMPLFVKEAGRAGLTRAQC
jgi:hypothetical protein